MSWKMKIWQAERFAGWRNRQMWFHKRDKPLCQKVKSAFMRIRYLRPCPGGFGNTRFSQGWRRSCLLATGGLPVTSGKPGGKVLRRRVEEVVAQTGRTWHFDIRFLQVEMFQIEWNRAGKSFSHVVFRCFPLPCTDISRTTCGEKKCFFSRMENQSLEIETRLGLKR